MVTGSCLCGAVAFEIDGRVTDIQLCHAARCRKATGAAFAPELAAERADFRFVKGGSEVQTWEAPVLHEPPAYKRAFCRHCGSPLPWELDGTPFMVVLAGVLDGDFGTRPFRHAWTDEGAPWFEIADGLPSFGEAVPAGERLPKRGQD